MRNLLQSCFFFLNLVEFSLLRILLNLYPHIIIPLNLLSLTWRTNSVQNMPKVCSTLDILIITDHIGKVGFGNRVRDF